MESVCTETSRGFSMDKAYKGVHYSEKECKRLYRCYKAGDNTAMIQLIQGYCDRVLKIYDKYFSFVEDRYKDDCLQTGYIAVYQAIESYKDSETFNLTAWVRRMIFWGITRFIKDNNLINIPDKAYKNYIKAKSNDEEVDPLADNLLNLEVFNEDSENLGENYLYEFDDKVATGLVLAKFLKSELNEREYGVLIGMSVYNMTAIELAHKYGITRERIFQLRDRAIRKLERNEEFCDAFGRKVQKPSQYRRVNSKRGSSFMDS